MDEERAPAGTSRVLVKNRYVQYQIQLPTCHSVVQVFTFRRVNGDSFWARAGGFFSVQNYVGRDDAKAFWWQGNIDKVVAGQGTLTIT